jgi:hypothetical protein
MNGSFSHDYGLKTFPSAPWCGLHCQFQLQASLYFYIPVLHSTQSSQIFTRYKPKEERYCTHVTLLQMKCNKYYILHVGVWALACSLIYPACNAPRYCHLWPLWFQHVLRHYVINTTIFEEKKLLNTECVFWFFLQSLFKIFLILTRIQRDTVINIKTSSCKVPVTLVRF